MALGAEFAAGLAASMLHIGFWHGEDSGRPGALEQQVSLLGDRSDKVRRAVRTRHRRIERRSESVGPVPRGGSPCSAAGSCILAVASVSACCNRRIRPASESREIQTGRRQDRSSGKRRVISQRRFAFQLSRLEAEQLGTVRSTGLQADGARP